MVDFTKGKRAVPRVILLGAIVALLFATPVAAQSAYTPTAPTPGALYKDGPSGRYLLGGTWLFRYDDGVGLRDGFPNSSSIVGWSQITVPNAWNATDESLASFEGTAAWYRRDFLLPDANAGLTWIVRFESVNYFADIWLNGHRIGTHAGAFLPFEIALPAKYLSRSGANRLVIRVDNQRSRTDLPPAGTSSTTGEPAGGWWNYGGLLGEVYLRRVDRVDFSSVQVLPELPCATCTATIDYHVALQNYGANAERVHLAAHYGAVALNLGTQTLAAGAQAMYTGKLRVAHPQLWWPSSPYLYDATLDASAGLAHGGKLKNVAHYYLESGIRSIRVVAGHLLLNGEPLHFRGVGLQEDSPTEGFAIDNATRQQFITDVKTLGATVVRTQYPAFPQLEELADESGVMLWSEIPVYQVEAQYLHAITPTALSMLRQNILDNGNHPSVIIWSIANELSSKVGNAQSTYIRAAVSTAHALDPTRPVALAMAGLPSVGCQRGYGPLDLIGINDYFGWYTGPDGQIADPELLGGFLNEMRSCYPRQALVISEFGAEGNRNGLTEERGTYEYQDSFISQQLATIASKPFLSGALYWALEDFPVRPGWTGSDPYPDPPLLQKGLLDFYGNQKPAFSLIQSLYQSTQQVG